MSVFKATLTSATGEIFIETLDHVNIEGTLPGKQCPHCGNRWWMPSAKVPGKFCTTCGMSEKLEKKLETKKKPESCPYCPDQGWYAKHGCHYGEPEKIQCEWCHVTPNSVFNIIGKRQEK